MNGVKPWFLFGDLISEVLDIQAIQYIFTENYHNYDRFFTSGKCPAILYRGEAKRFYRIYLESLCSPQTMNKLLPIVKDETFNFSSWLSKTFLGDSKESYKYLKAKNSLYDRGWIDFIHYLFPFLLNFPTDFAKKQHKLKDEMRLYHIIAMKAYYNVNSKSVDDKYENSLINIIAETSFKDKEGLSLEEIKLCSYIFNISSIVGPIFVMKVVLYQLIKNPQVETKMRKEIKQVLSKNKHTIHSFDYSDLQDMTYVDAVIDESIRLHPPFARLIPRKTRDSDRLLGYHIPHSLREKKN
eukprot:gene7912-9738_t